MKILTVGDVVGVAGTAYIRKNLWRIRKECGADMAVVNGENAAKGNGVDKDAAETLFASGADVVTSGNHIWKKYETKHLLEEMPSLLRPANYPEGTPGKGCGIYTLDDGRKIGVMPAGVGEGKKQIWK